MGSTELSMLWIREYRITTPTGFLCLQGRNTANAYCLHLSISSIQIKALQNLRDKCVEILEKDHKHLFPRITFSETDRDLNKQLISQAFQQNTTWYSTTNNEGMTSHFMKFKVIETNGRLLVDIFSDFSETFYSQIPHKEEKEMCTEEILQCIPRGAQIGFIGQLVGIVVFDNAWYFACKAEVVNILEQEKPVHAGTKRKAETDIF